MEKFEIHIGRVYDMKNKTEKPEITIVISKEQFEILQQFADTRKDENLNTVYIINKIEFTVSPNMSENGESLTYLEEIEKRTQKFDG